MKSYISNLQDYYDRASLEEQKAWLNLIIGDLQAEKGQQLAHLIALGLRVGLKKPNITAENIRLRNQLVDSEGLIFPRGFTTEVDLIAEDNKLTVFRVFELKAKVKAGDVGVFGLMVELVAAQNPTKTVKGMLICLGPGEEIRQSCVEYGVELIEAEPLWLNLEELLAGHILQS